MTYQPATAANYPALVSLLTQVDLLTADLPADLSTFTLAFDNDVLAGAAGLEVFGQTGLLRSVAVLPAYQKQKVGRQLIDVAQQLARQQGVAQLFLITTTAADYFDQLGYQRVDRSNVPDAIAQTRQFSNLCPASAVVMRIEI